MTNPLWRKINPRGDDIPWWMGSSFRHGDGIVALPYPLSFVVAAFALTIRVTRDPIRRVDYARRIRELEFRDEIQGRIITSAIPVLKLARELLDSKQEEWDKKGAELLKAINSHEDMADKLKLEVMNRSRSQSRRETQP